MSEPSSEPHPLPKVGDMTDREMLQELVVFTRDMAAAMDQFFDKMRANPLTRKMFGG